MRPTYLLCEAHGALSCLLHYPVGTPFWCPLCEKVWKWRQGRQPLKVDVRGVV